MDREEYTFQALLVDDKGKIPIEAKYSAKFAVQIKFLDDQIREDGYEFRNLVFIIDDEQVDLGPCRFLTQSEGDGHAGYLFFVGDIYDLDSLLFHKKKVILQGPFGNLPIILEHKHKIRQQFKDYTASLTYDLSVYKNLFDSLDAEYAFEPEMVRKVVQQTIIANEGKTFFEYFDSQLRELQRIVADFSKEEHERHGFYFRKQVWNYITLTPFMRRTNLKPRGYSGDSAMMRMIYIKEELGDSTFSKLLHKHCIERPAAEAVRNRRTLIANTLINKLSNSVLSPGERFKVLSVACGPAFEIQDLLSNPKDCEIYDFTLLDQDKAALAEAASLVGQIELNLGARIKVGYLQESVRTMLSTLRLASKLGQFHFIYSMGLFDYLTPPVARAVLWNLYQLLQPEGEMIVGNFHVSNPNRIYMEYWGDWVLYYRTEEEFFNLLKSGAEAARSTTFDETGIQMFLQIKRLR
ncbi:MAG: class I SAM-dependent methyltransferase [Fidelibacterota bacterium]|nr:MAG: class I SAM-dependent methyltransferase [Candidatus Neomarinimicrobiota bacterium]